MVRHEITDEELVTIRGLADSKYRSHEWNYNDLSEMNYVNRERFNAGFVEVRMNILDGKIQEVVLSGDFFEGTLPLEQLKQTLIGKEYDFYHIHEILERLNVSDYIQNLENHEFMSLLFSGK